MEFDWVRLIALLEMLVVSALYARTVYKAFYNARRSAENRRFNVGRGLASLGVIIANMAIAQYVIERWGDTYEPPYYALVFLANIVFLFGWVYSVRVTLRNGKPEY